MPTACWFSLERGGGRVPVAELGRELVGVLDGGGDRLGDRVGAGVGGGDDDHVLVVGARVAGRLVVRAGGGREPEGGAAVDLEQLAVGAAGDGEGGRVAGIGVRTRPSVRTFSYVLVDRGGPAGGEGGGLVVEGSWTVTVTVIDVGVGPVGDLDHDGARCRSCHRRRSRGSRSRAPRRRRARRRRRR